MSIKVIVALDFNDEKRALGLVDIVNPNDCGLKVGSEMFTLFGPDFVKSLVSRGFKVFLDLKFHDIPNTVSNACKAAADLGVWMMNVHASGGLAMMLAAKKSLESYGNERPLLIAVTILTSMDQKALSMISVSGSVLSQVIKLSQLASEAELDGVVCSALEVSSIKTAVSSEFLAVTPGIRLPESAHDDQTRIMTPTQAIQSGSDYLVIGRPITNAPRPELVIEKILATI